MNACREVQAQIQLYLDDELRDGDQSDLESHLEGCPACQAVVQGERAFLEDVRASRPLHEASDELTSRVQDVLLDSRPPKLASDRLRKQVDSLTRRTLQSTGDRTRIRRMLSIAALTVFLIAAAALGWFALSGDKAAAPSEVAQMAVGTHRRYIDGKLPLEVVSNSPRVISGWFDGKVSFSLTLPNYQESSGQDQLYRLTGARLVSFKNDYAAYVAYQMRNRPISLVVTANSVAMPSGGEEIISNGLKFHYDSMAGLKVLTWADRGLTYALVSDLDERGQQSCVVCHEGARDRNLIESLKPRD